MNTVETTLGSFSALQISPLQEVRAVVVLLHGYAMDAEDLAPLAQAMGLPAVLYCVRAPLKAPRGRAWWPVDEERRSAQLQVGARDLSSEYPAGREALRAALRDVVASVRVRHPRAPVVLAGFSQGGMLACDTVLHGGLDLAGLVLMSSSRIAHREWEPRLSAVKGLPVLVTHGTLDADLALAAGEGLRDDLSRGGALVEWFAFEGPHGIPMPVWRLFRKFVVHRLAT